MCLSLSLLKFIIIIEIVILINGLYVCKVEMSFGCLIRFRLNLSLNLKDFVIIESESESEVIFQSKIEGMQAIMIEVPTVTNYPLHWK
ncbi:hypothetical protein ASD40_02570 [Paenibacillus sp. Root444D2]|nr:hypothetical protein ASD40_02570 [Paenibacillus sp. Root444D2]KRE51940.1 hypothetical protein ASG85_02050 [Paenibacillus sp. Soil724D2]